MDWLRVDWLRVGWSALFESGLQQKGFQKFHFILMKACYFESDFFCIGYISVLFGSILNK